MSKTDQLYELCGRFHNNHKNKYGKRCTKSLAIVKQTQTHTLISYKQKRRHRITQRKNNSIQLIRTDTRQNGYFSETTTFLIRIKEPSREMLRHFTNMRFFFMMFVASLNRTAQI